MNSCGMMDRGIRGLHHIPYMKGYSASHSLWMHSYSRFHRQISYSCQGYSLLDGLTTFHHITRTIPLTRLSRSSLVEVHSNFGGLMCHSSSRLYPALHVSARLEYWELRFTYFHGQSNLEMVVKFCSFRSEIGQYQNTL